MAGLPNLALVKVNTSDTIRRHRLTSTAIARLSRTTTGRGPRITAIRKSNLGRIDGNARIGTNRVLAHLKTGRAIMGAYFALIDVYARALKLFEPSRTKIGTWCRGGHDGLRH